MASPTIGDPVGGDPASGAAAADGPQTGRVEHVPARRAPGLLILTGVVLMGLVPTSLYFHWKVPGVIEEFRELVRNAPKEPAERLAVWFEMNSPQVHNRLSQFRLDVNQPWMVVYGLATEPTASTAPGTALDLWGIDLAGLPIEVVVLDGLEVSVALEEPVALGRHVPLGPNADRIPRYTDRAAAPDPAERAMDMIEYALRYPDDFLLAFEEDNPGTRFVLRVGDAERVVAESAPAPAPQDPPAKDG